jgi:hypothetical protein
MSRRRGPRRGVALALLTLQTLQTLLAAAAGTAAAAPALNLPQRNLKVELRFVTAGQADAGDDEAAAAAPHADFTVGTQMAPAPPRPVLTVLNGAWGAIRLGQTLPVQWLQAAAAPSGPGAASAAQRGGSVVQGLFWVEAGQALAVRPQWPGGAQPVTLQIRYDAAAGVERSGAALPATSHQQAGTTLRLPLGRWTTFARIDAAAAAAPAHGARTWSTRPAAADPAGQALQVRVTAP